MKKDDFEWIPDNKLLERYLKGGKNLSGYTEIGKYFTDKKHRLNLTWILDNMDSIQ